MENTKNNKGTNCKLATSGGNMKKLYLLSFFLFFFCYNLTAQTFSSKEIRKEVENILNTVINSVPFDSVYNCQRRVYFLANELLTENSVLILQKKKCRAKIVNEKKIHKIKQYIVLGDFTVDWENITAARVMLDIMPENKMLGMYLVKDDRKWIIKNYIIRIENFD